MDITIKMVSFQIIENVFKVKFTLVKVTTKEGGGQKIFLHFIPHFNYEIKLSGVETSKRSTTFTKVLDFHTF